MEFKLLKTFHAVATLRSFTRAAHALHLAQSSVSAQVQALEHDLGVPLFDRLGRRVRLTEAGERLLVYARRMVDLAEAARSELSGEGEARATLTVRVPETLAAQRLPEAVRRFTERFPKARLVLTTCTLDGLAEDLRKGVVDAGFLLADAVPGAALDVEVLGSEELVLAAHPGHELARAARVGVDMLAGETLLLARTDCSYRKVLERMMADAGAVPRAVHEFTSVDALRRCAVAGAGVTVLPRCAVADDLARGALAELRWDAAPVEVGVLLVRHRDMWLSPTLEAFLGMAAEAVRKAGREGAEARRP
ncbi:MAG: LysR family transcriptional regulator [Desulfovibrionaceae bacterium]